MNSDMAPELYTIWTEAKDHIEQGSYDKAIEIYRYVLIRYGDNEIAAEYANAYLGDIFLTLRQLDLAESHIKKAINYKPENAGYHYLLGFTYSIKRQWGKAIEEFEVAVDAEPNNGEYLRGLGWAIYSSGDKKKGLAYLHKAVDLAPTNVNILTDLAAAYLSLANSNKAREYGEKAVKIEPQNTLAQEVLKTIHSFQEEFQHLDKLVVKAKKRSLPGSNIIKIYQFKVSLKETPNIWRIIEIKENQMLSSLHKAIFTAFNRFDEHLYSFFMSNKPYDKDSEYTLPDPDDEQRVGKYANRVRIDTLHLQPGQKFLYLFDYGDEWWHEVELTGLIDKVPRGKYPKVTKKHGKSPPQYPDEL